MDLLKRVQLERRPISEGGQYWCCYVAVYTLIQGLRIAVQDSGPKVCSGLVPRAALSMFLTFAIPGLALLIQMKGKYKAEPSD